VLDFRTGVKVPVLGVGAVVVTTVGGEPHRHTPHSGVGVLVPVSRMGVVPLEKKPVGVVPAPLVVVVESKYGSTPAVVGVVVWRRYGSNPVGGGGVSCLLILRPPVVPVVSPVGEQGSPEMEQ